MSNDLIADFRAKQSLITRVLVIDDNPDILEIVSRSLNGTEFYVIGASNGREGIQVAKEQKPGIILLDITMPGFDGFMTGKVIKRNPDTKTIPIIFLSGRKTKQDINAAIQAGGSDYIVKPFSPHDLLTRMRRALHMQEVEQKRNAVKLPGVSGTAAIAVPETQVFVHDIQSFVRHGDVIVCPLLTPALTIDNVQIYRGIFANLVTDGFLKVVLDAGKIEKIDGSGLGLLVSVNEALKSSSGSLKIVLPEQGQFKQMLYAKLNDIIGCFDSVQEAVECFAVQEQEPDAVEPPESQEVCMVCTNINDHDSRYCKYCGSNLVISRGINLLDVIRRVMSRAVMLEAIDKLKNTKTNKETIIDENIPSEFLIEVAEDPVTLHYRAALLDKGNAVSRQEIGIRAPYIQKTLVPLQPGMSITMRNTQGGSGIFESVITSIENNKGIIYVRYTDDAKILLSQKNFSVAPRRPITLYITNPAFNSMGGVIEAKILEVSRVRMVIFSDQLIPEKECLSISFQLHDGFEISSPLVIAMKRKERFMYDIEFAVIDEREQTKMVQFMYKRQIELAKGLEK